MTNKELHESQEKLAEKLDAVIPHLDVISNMVKNHEKMLNGNGQPGLVAEFSKVKTRQDECRAYTRSRRSEILALCAVAVAAISPFVPVVFKMVTK
jgi:hypothetical protein